MGSEWLASVKPLMSNEEYVRLKYNTIVEQILSALNNSCDVNKCNAKLLCDHLNVLLQAFNFNRKHPSPQRCLTLSQIAVMVNRLTISESFGINDSNTNNHIKISEEINAQNLLVKCLKCGIKDTIGGHEEDKYNDVLMCDICEKLVAYLKCQKVLLKSLTTLTPSSTAVIALNHLTLNTLRCVYMLLSRFKISINTRDVNTFCGNILGILKVYAFYCFAGYDINKISNTCIYASPLSQFVSPLDSAGGGSGESVKNKGSKSKARSKRKTKNRGKQIDVEYDDNEDQMIFTSNNGKALSPINTSESEFSSSDYETNYGLNCLTNRLLNIDDINIYQRSIANKMRFISYECLAITVDKFEKRTIFGFWSSFIPDDSSAPPSSSQLTVFSSILRDPSDKVRSSALRFLNRLLQTGEQFVPTLAADDMKQTRLQSKPISFTTISQSLAEMVREIHCGLSLLLVTESNTDILINAFKCASIVINTTPYNKLRAGLLTTLFYKTLFALNNKDIQIQKSCLAFACNALELEPIPEELKQWLSSADGSASMKKLLSFSVQSILNPLSITLCGESLKLLTTILRPKLSALTVNNNRIDFGINIWQVLEIGQKCADYDITVNNNVIQNLVCKYLYAIGVCLKIILSSGENKSSGDTINEEEIVIKCKNWWISIMKSQLICAALKSNSATNNNNNNNLIALSSQCLLIDFLSTICSPIFESLNTTEKYHLISLLFSVANNVSSIDDLSGHSSAIRCLAVYQSFPSMIEDVSYLCDVCHVSVEIINKYLAVYSDKKESQTLLNQCAWSLANFCDIIRKNYVNNREDISDAFLFNLLNTVLIAFDIEIAGIVGENIATNLVRSAGYVCYILLVRESSSSSQDTVTNETLQKCLQLLIEKLLHYLSHSKYFKLQWNVCIVFGYLLSVQVFTKYSLNNTLKTVTISEQPLIIISEIYSTILTVIKSTRNYKVQCYAVNAICTPNEYDFLSNCDGISMCSLWCDLVMILLNNYSLVPHNIRNNWFNNFYSGIKKLLLFSLSNKNSSQQSFRDNKEVKQCCARLREFLSDCDETVVTIDNDVILKSLIEILNV